MRKKMLLLAVFGLVGLLWAADGPFISGTFKLNLAKSKAPANMVGNTKEAIVVFRELDANTMEATSTETRKDGTTVTAKWTVPKSGGIQKYQQGGPAEGITIVSTVIDANTVYNTYLQNGKQVGLMRVTNGKDGKSLTSTWKGTDSQGKPIEGFILYEKQ
jgi:hypothetical protein